jgi:hypothetical protein
MNTSETIFLTSPNPDYIFGDSDRVAPNQEGLAISLMDRKV